MVVFSKTALVGKASSKTVLLEALGKSNALNQTGLLDYNKFGVKDGVGLESVTEMFIDNFVLHLAVPQSCVKDKKFLHVGSVNKTIRELLDGFDLKNCPVKGIGFHKCVQSPPEHMLALSKFNSVSDEYYIQEYKIATPNQPYKMVLEFLNSKCFESCGLVVKDIDVTTDFSGSFDKDEIVEYLIKNCDFRYQGDEDVLSPRTILDNDKFVGRNCLTYLEEIGGFLTRQKVYNKFAQMIECQSVRASVGNHLKDWATQQETRLASARDASSKRGLTRAEVTFYVENNVLPTSTFMEQTLAGVTAYIPEDLVYSTPFSSMWLAYCDILRHSLLAIDRKQDVGLLIYSLNEVTGKISGQLIESISSKEKWVIERLTFNAVLPVDILEINTLSSVSNNAAEEPEDPDIDIVFNRYFKSHNNMSTEFKTRLVSQKGVFSYVNDTEDNLNRMLETAGMLPHRNCVPHISNKAANTKSKVSVLLHHADTLTVSLPFRTRKMSSQDPSELAAKLTEEVERINAMRGPALNDLTRSQQRIEKMEGLMASFKRTRNLKLIYLQQFINYPVLSAVKHGQRYKLLLDADSRKYTVWSNWHLTQEFDRFVKDHPDFYDQASGFIFLPGESCLANLIIRGKGLNDYGNYTVYSKIQFVPSSPPPPTEQLCEPSCCQLNESSKPKTKDTALELISIKSREDLLPYPENPTLASLPINSLKGIESIGWVTYRGKDKLLVEIDKVMYQAGKDLEGKIDEIKKGSYIKIEKVVTQTTTRRKEVLCSIVQNGEWHKLIEYNKCLLYNSSTPLCTRAMDVKEMKVKDGKRKVVLTADGQIVRFNKRSRIEDDINVGDIL